MLDSVTKKRIDDLRNILVGKIPDPKSQVEQITTGLIYKFMHDMDEEAVEMGGVPSFFTGDFEKYSWTNLFDPKLGGADKVQLYSDAIEGMYTNPMAPPLFREIFKNSFLPFKDPSTLNMFLKEINEFHYSHSEKLGDAFEYLLSFMGSQGDAGQFRTPRHIIDFIVEIVNPQKNETILDPACGTAGFLISSYKHILSQNTDKKLGDKLSAAERKQVGDSLVGYDISPDMTRMSLVNMYLHQFASPLIHEYDTLSSEDRWNEYYDVILANPPFFSPKGGIQPHSRFGVSSTKAEVLFTDYIIEHLKPTGRAGIIVPEGIIFQTNTAYKTLRKKLVEDCLVGVISLPAGVFQPYSGVKTSILILDKELNQKSDSIFFVKVENDGFSLGSQRTPIAKNDLPELLQSIKDGQSSNGNYQSVKTDDVLSDDTYSLSASRYVEAVEHNSNYDMVSILDTFDVLTPPTKIKTKDFLETGQIPIIDQSSNRISGYWNDINDCLKVENPVVIFGDHTKVVKFVDFNFVAGADGIKVLSPRANILPKFLFFILKSLDLPDLGYSRHFKELKLREIPLPPIEIQQQIVDELEGYQKIIDGCRQVVENYKPTIDIDPSWEMIELGEMATTEYGTSEKSLSDGQYVVLRMGNLQGGEIEFSDLVYSDNHGDFKKLELCEGDVLFNRTNSPALVGKASIFRGHSQPSMFAGYLVRVKVNKGQLLPEYLNVILNSSYGEALNEKNVSVSGNQANINATKLRGYPIPTPSLETQRSLVDSINIERNLVNSSKQLINIYTQKIQDRISKVWGE
jgi:type I restriction enzyme M protein